MGVLHGGKKMTDRKKLAFLLSTSPYLDVVDGRSYEQAADDLIANGVKVVGAETNLAGKCGSCTFAKPIRFGSSTCYVECTNEDHLSRRTKRYAEAKRQRTSKACKRYVPLPEPPKGGMLGE